MAVAELSALNELFVQINSRVFMNDDGNEDYSPPSTPSQPPPPPPPSSQKVDVSAVPGIPPESSWPYAL